MGTRIGASFPDGTEMLAADWQPASQRVSDYLTAMGVSEPLDMERLVAQVRLRVDSRAIAAPLEDIVESAIEETHALLDEWLVAELGHEADANNLEAARAAVLSGHVSGWSARWVSFIIGLTDHSLAPAIHALTILPLPEPAPLVMDANVIDLCCHRLRRRIAAAICRFFCHPELRTPAHGGSS